MGAEGEWSEGQRGGQRRDLKDMGAEGEWSEGQGQRGSDLKIGEGGWGEAAVAQW